MVGLESSKTKRRKPAASCFTCTYQEQVTLDHSTEQVMLDHSTEHSYLQTRKLWASSLQQHKTRKLYCCGSLANGTLSRLVIRNALGIKEQKIQSICVENMIKKTLLMKLVMKRC